MALFEGPILEFLNSPPWFVSAAHVDDVRALYNAWRSTYEEKDKLCRELTVRTALLSNIAQLTKDYE